MIHLGELAKQAFEINRDNGGISRKEVRLKGLKRPFDAM